MQNVGLRGSDSRAQLENQRQSEQQHDQILKLAVQYTNRMYFLGMVHKRVVSQEF